MFFAIPLELQERVPSRVVPWVNYGLILANLAVYVLTLCFGIYWTVGPGTGLASLLLYGFSHAGFWHFAFNMVALWVFGNAANRRLGNGWYLLAYLGTILALGLISRLLMPAQLLGASGGVFAVMIICFMLLPSARLTIGYAVLFPLTLLIGLFQPPKYALYWLVRGGEFSIPALWGLLLVPLMELWTLFWSGWGLTPLGHLLGMLCGLAVVLLLPTSVSMRRSAAAQTY
jgi:membrane associated rhomboid family serine protease